MSFDKLNDALFAQMERLAAADGEEGVTREVERSRAVSALAGRVIENARNAIRVVEMREGGVIGLAEGVGEHPSMPRMLTEADGHAR